MAKDGAGEVGERLRELSVTYGGAEISRLFPAGKVPSNSRSNNHQFASAELSTFHTDLKRFY
jgi:hypothetical protein